MFFPLKLEARLWKDNAYFMAGEIRYNLEFGEASGVELDQAYAVRVRALNAAGNFHFYSSHSSSIIIVK